MMNKKMFYISISIVVSAIIFSYLIAYLVAFIVDEKLGEVLLDGTTFASRLGVPVMLAIWAGYSEKKKGDRELERINREKEEQKRKEEKEYIRNHIKEEFKSYTLFNYVFKEKKSNEEAYKDEIKELLSNCSLKLIPFLPLIQQLSYAYMCEYFTILRELTSEITDRDDLSVKDLYTSFVGFSANINYIEHLLLLDKEQYQKISPIVINAFVVEKGVIRDITLEFLKKYPQYHKSALEILKD